MPSEITSGGPVLKADLKNAFNLVSRQAYVNVSLYFLMFLCGLFLVLWGSCFMHFP